MAFVTRFAPSPTGPLHLGHAFSALLAHDMALEAGGTMLLRIEDIDRQRSRPAWEAEIVRDLRWLGLRWPEPVMRQSGRLPAYREALAGLWARGLLYPCTCTRRDVENAVGAPQEGVPGPDGPAYPGTCRGARRTGALPEGAALRLDMGLATRGWAEVAFVDATRGRTPTRAEAFVAMGDVVLARRGMGTSYHLAVVLDDAAQGVTDVVRGEDLFEATRIHALLQRLLGLPTPAYHHHPLVRDEHGKRLAKRDDARALGLYRDAGLSPEEIRGIVGLRAGPEVTTSAPPCTAV